MENNRYGIFKQIWSEDEFKHYTCTLCGERIEVGLINLSEHFFSCSKNTDQRVYIPAKFRSREQLLELLDKFKKL